MVSTASFASVTAVLVACASRVNGHGYVYDPKSEFSGSDNSAWIVQIDPQWDGDWQGNDAASATLYKELAAEKGVSNIRQILDDTSIYGAACGFTLADATPKSIPTTGAATFSRGIIHHGPCEIWLDDTLVMQNDDCMAAYGGDEDVKSILPVDYSSCSSSGCMLRFYWLAFQGVNGETVWQVYKDCVPLAGSGTSSTVASDSDSTTSVSSSQSNSTTSTTSTESTPTPTTATPTTAPSSDNGDATSTTAPSTDSGNSNQWPGNWNNNGGGWSGGFGGWGGRH